MNKHNQTNKPKKERKIPFDVVKKKGEKKHKFMLARLIDGWGKKKVEPNNIIVCLCKPDHFFWTNHLQNLQAPSRPLRNHHQYI